MAVGYHEIAEGIKNVDLESKILLKEYCEQLIHAERRAQLVRNVEASLSEEAEGKLKTYNSMKELRADLDAD
jgi:hypothetical protein